MAKYIIDSETLHGLADALRKVTGETRTYTPTEMIEAVTTVMDAATYILVDEEGNEIPAVFVENETTIDATPNDIREGVTAITNAGVTVGEKFIPSYIVTEGARKIAAGEDFTLKIRDGMYAYTKLQALFCAFNTAVSDSVATDRVAINDNVYAVNSTDAIATITLDDENESIVFNVTNNTDGAYVLRYFSYKEEY